MRYAYRASEGRVTDLRFIAADYEPLPDEIVGEADVLPNLRDLPEYRAEANPVVEALPKIGAF